MKKEKKGYRINIAVQRQRLRLTEDISWFPYPAAISFGLVLLLMFYLISSVGPRTGNMANIITFNTERQKEGGIWIGIYPQKENLVLVTSDKNRFEWPLNLHDKKEVDNFDRYLQSKIINLSTTLALNKEVAITQTIFVLAVDEKLKYIHIKPIINLLPKNNITRYGFETRIMKGTH